jgi:hypothetical protein
VARPVYTRQLLADAQSAPFTAGFIAAAGYITVIRDISGNVSFPEPQNNIVSAFAGPSADPPGIMFRILPPFWLGEFHWQGRVALNPGDVFQFNLGISVAQGSVIVSGYQLTLP